MNRLWIRAEHQQTTIPIFTVCPHSLSPSLGLTDNFVTTLSCRVTQLSTFDMNEVSKFHVTGINQKQLNKAVQFQFTGGYSQEYSEEKTLKKKSKYS